MKVGRFSDAMAAVAAVNGPAVTFWEAYGHAAPKLRRFAMRILSQFPYASACERVWSEYGFIHSPVRNRLSHARAQDLVYVHGNARVLAELRREGQDVCCEWLQSESEKEVDQEKRVCRGIFDAEPQDVICHAYGVKHALADEYVEYDLIMEEHREEERIRAEEKEKQKQR